LKWLDYEQEHQACRRSCEGSRVWRSRYAAWANRPAPPRKPPISAAATVAQIVKSLIFQGKRQRPAAPVPGRRQQPARHFQGRCSCRRKLERADPRLIRDRTGFAIGGVAPIGHLEPIAAFADEALLGYDVVWAAAGAHDAVFSAEPKALVAAAGLWLTLSPSGSVEAMVRSSRWASESSRSLLSRKKNAGGATISGMSRLFEPAFGQLPSSGLERIAVDGEGDHDARKCTQRGQDVDPEPAGRGKVNALRHGGFPYDARLPASR
jgi:prolyl-tRNA editing enzyme YbaK/EbsC (Cys-tRNA(Pro) deacylase)